MEENMVFFKEGPPVAFYGYRPYSYPPRSVEEKKAKWAQDVHLFHHLQVNGYQARLWRIRRRDKTEEQLERLAQSAPQENQQAAHKVMALWKSWLPQVVSPQYFTVIGVELPVHSSPTSEPLRRLKRSFLRGLGTGGDEVLKDELRQALEAEQAVRRRLGELSRMLVPLLPQEIADYIYRNHYWRGMEFPPLPKQLVKLWPKGRRMYTWLCEGSVREFSNYVRVQHRDHQRYVSFVVVAGLPETISFPGDEVMYYLPLRCPYTVDCMFHWVHISPENAQLFARKKQEDVEDSLHHLAAINRQPTPELIEKKGYADAFSEYVRKHEVPMLQGHLVFCVDGRTEEEVNRHANDVIRKLRDYNLVGYQPSDVQRALFESWLPGGWDWMIGYDEPILPEVAAAYTAPGATDLLGDGRGAPIALTEQGALVFWDPARGPQINKDAGMAIIGPLGSGKSFLLNTLIYYAALIWDARVFVVDIKEERSHWPGQLPGLENKVYRLVLDGRQRPGVMDPFRLMKDKDMARAVAVSMIGLVRKRGLEDEENTELLRAAQLTVADGNPSMRKMLQILKGFESHEARQIAGFLEQVADLPQGKLLFGNPNEEATAIQDDLFLGDELTNRGIILLQLAGLKLPDPNVRKEDMELDQRVSMAVMMSTALLAERFILSDRRGFKVAALDEAWAWLRTDQGKELANKLQRAGRSANAGIWYATQKPSDVKEMVDLLSTYICLGTTSDEETELAIEALGLNDTLEVRSKLKRIRHVLAGDEESIDFARSLQADEMGASKGYFKDLSGRVGFCSFELPDQRLVKIFNTKPEMVAASKL
jgi:hypothetical protein